MSVVSFADIVHQQLSFSNEVESERLVLELIDTPWVQRLRDISQTANTRMVYMFSEHSRFGHSLGVAFLANVLMEKLAAHYPDEIRPYRSAVNAAALLHDLGHLAPGSHTAYKTWWPQRPDEHEQVSVRIVEDDPVISGILRRYEPKLPSVVGKILTESEELPPWTWEIISGGGWNVDRGNWCIADSITAGVSYGKYNIPALTDSIIISPDKHLALNESRLDAMMHFTLSRHAMYRQVYQHRVLLSVDTLNQAVVRRARDVPPSELFADETMRAALDASSPAALSLKNIFDMRESWWRYHLTRWIDGSDKVLADLAGRLRDRRLFKTVRIRETDDRAKLREAAAAAVRAAGYDPRYYLHEIETYDMHAGDTRQSMLVVMDDGRVRHLTEAEPLFQAMVRESKNALKSWFALPQEAKERLGRTR